MSYNATLIGCSSVNQFFDRFSANDHQGKNYHPIFLAIVYSSYGECCPSFGLFERNGQLYTVYGTECSIWDFNGQFEPELTTIDSLLLDTQEGIGFVDGRDVFNTKLSKCIKELQLSDKYSNSHNNSLVQDYMQYINSFVVGNIDISNSLEVFTSNLLEIEDHIIVYKFNVQAEWDELLSLYLTPDGKLSCAATKNEKYVTMNAFCVQKFISDFMGSIELGMNIFEKQSKKKLAIS